MKNVIEQGSLTDVKEIAKVLKGAGYKTHHLTRNLRKSGYTLHRIRRQNGHQGFAITKEDAEKFLSTYERVIVEENKLVSDVPRKFE